MPSNGTDSTLTNDFFEREKLKRRFECGQMKGNEISLVKTGMASRSLTDSEEAAVTSS